MTPLEQDDYAKVVHNEQVKLLATFLNGVGLAIFAVGGLAPIFTSSMRFDANGLMTVGVSLLCFAIGVVGHLGASRMLRRLKP